MKPMTNVIDPRLISGCRDTNVVGPCLACSLRSSQIAGKNGAK